MGGAGARNKRRLQRQQHAQSEPSVKQEEFELSFRNSSKPKAKKPKHLKRKLEQAENSSDKERVLQEMQAWEQQKAEYLRKKQKKADVYRKKQEADIVAEKQVEEPTTESSEPFPRNVKDECMEKESTTQKKCSLEPLKEDVMKATTQQDSDDDSEAPDAAPKRQRGKRRRGRKDTSQKIKEDTDKSAVSVADSKKHDDDEVKSPEKKKKKDNARYCVGRKPVTDFVIGQRYPGKVVYVKPFGVFLDIGCHSDAFCHVSRLQDDYVESPEAILKPGDSVDARVVEVDRKKKRITVSLQTDAKMDDERASIEARQQRLEKRKKSHEKEDRTPVESSDKHTDTAIQESQQNDERDDMEHLPGIDKSESEMMPAELKRKRKLERRAARRAAKQEAAE